MHTFNRVYDEYAQAQRTVEDLEARGIPSSDISLVANRHDHEEGENGSVISATGAGAGIGAAVGGGVGLLTGLGLMAIPGLGPVVAAGWLAATAAGAVAGTATGGVIGALVDAGTSESDAHVYSEVVRRGGTLVTVRTSLAASDIEPILDRHGPIDPAVRRADYEQTGWRSFDRDPVSASPERKGIDEMRAP